METVSELMERPYDVVIRERDRKFYAHSSDLMLSAEGATVNEAYEALRDLMRTQFEHFVSMGEAATIPLPRAQRERLAFVRTVKPFLFKSAVVALVGALLIIAANVSIVYTIRDTPKHLAQTAGRTMLHRFVKNLDEFAKKEITPAREEKIRQVIRDIVPRLKPYARDLAPLFEEVMVSSKEQ